MNPIDECLLLIEELQPKTTDLIDTYYPDKGPLRREKYPKHLQFFEAGKVHQERAAIAANRVGKTTLGVFEVSTHLLGNYKKWWPGRRFDHPTDWWAAGDTSETTRNILQYAFLGAPGQIGTGMLPKDSICDVSSKRGLADAIDTVLIKNKFGGTSTLSFKAFDQGREKFQGTAKHGILLDEECSLQIYMECLMRLMTTDGLMIATFTPLRGMSEVVLRFMPDLAPKEVE